MNQPAPADPATAPLPASDHLFQGVRHAAPLPDRPICSLAIDAEEDFDWNHPVHATFYSTACMHRIGDLRQVLHAYRLYPTYLLTYPVLEDADAVAMIRRQYDRGECDMGVQLHPWVTPPFDEPTNQMSYLGRLDPLVEERKLVSLVERFRTCFGFAPTMFRAGRYGLSGATTRLLEQHGFLIDTSLAPRTDFQRGGGPDFSRYDCDPFWFGERRRLLELPLCRSLIGWSGRLAPSVYRAAIRQLPARWHMPSVLSRLRCAERVTLSPEGNDAAAMARFVRHRRHAGQTVFTLSMHSSSLAPGRNPYVRSRADLHVFYDRLSETLDCMASAGFGFATLAEIRAQMAEPA